MTHQESVEVRDLLDLPEHVQAVRLLAEVWQTAEPPLPADLLRALAHTGGYVAGAHLDGHLVGVSVGFLAVDGSLHSHISGVLTRARGRQVGTALKLHQRRWAIAHGLDTITWTFDPLLRRNAWFNLTKLGALAHEYLPCFYGDMLDGLNAGDQSDRLAVRWDLRGRGAEAALTGAAVPLSEGELLAAGAAIVLEEVDGSPRILSSAARSDVPLLLRIPHDIVDLRRADRQRAQDWRTALRKVLEPLLAADHVATGMTRTGYYVVTPPTGRGPL